MKRVKKRGRAGELLFDLQNYLELYLERSLRLGPTSIWYWEYYDAIKADIKDRKERRKIYQQIYHLERFAVVDKKGFTERGLKKIKELFKQKQEFEEEIVWDKKWRIVIFDIPEKRRVIRNRFRSYLEGVGFVKLQNSAWISPYGDFDEIQEVIRDNRIEKYVILMVVDKISNDALYRKKFDLL